MSTHFAEVNLVIKVVTVLTPPRGYLVRDTFLQVVHANLTSSPVRGPSSEQRVDDGWYVVNTDLNTLSEYHIAGKLLLGFVFVIFVTESPKMKINPDSRLL